MKLAIDVNYIEDSANIAGVLFENWNDKEPVKFIVTSISDIKPYISGQFYKRELPCILALLDELSVLPDVIVVDGYVHLSENKKGLGAYLYKELEGKIPIIGVAKNSFHKIPKETFVYRGKSKKPLFVTAIGIDLEQAKLCIEKMDGEYRIPTLLKEVDRICRL